MDWSSYFGPSAEQHVKIEFADVGCGYGGLLGRVIMLDYTQPQERERERVRESEQIESHI